MLIGILIERLGMLIAYTLIKDKNLPLYFSTETWPYLVTGTASPDSGFHLQTIETYYTGSKLNNFSDSIMFRTTNIFEIKVYSLLFSKYLWVGGLKAGVLLFKYYCSRYTNSIILKSVTWPERHYVRGYSFN